MSCEEYVDLLVRLFEIGKLTGRELFALLRTILFGWRCWA